MERAFARIRSVTVLSALFVIGIISQLHAQSGWTLEQCVDHALEHNLTIENRALDIVSSSSEKERALGLFLPNLNGYASHG